MVRTTNVVMAIDGILYDVKRRNDDDQHPSGTLEFVTERLRRLKHSLEMEAKHNGRTTKNR